MNEHETAEGETKVEERDTDARWRRRRRAARRVATARRAAVLAAVLWIVIGIPSVVLGDGPAPVDGFVFLDVVVLLLLAWGLERFYVVCSVVLLLHPVAIAVLSILYGMNPLILGGAVAFAYVFASGLAGAVTLRWMGAGRLTDI